MTSSCVKELEHALLESKKEIATLKEQLHISIISLKKAEDTLRVSDTETLKSNQDILKHHTGIFSNYYSLLYIYHFYKLGMPDWDVFKALFELLEPDLPEGPKLSKLNTLMMFFLWIRLNYGTDDIVYRFGVNRGTVSRHFHNVLDIVYVKTKSLIKWPEREVLRLTMPTSFRKFFKKCAVIIDCTEIFVERPTDLLARAQVWSN